MSVYHYASNWEAVRLVESMHEALYLYTLSFEASLSLQDKVVHRCSAGFRGKCRLPAVATAALHASTALRKPIEVQGSAHLHETIFAPLPVKSAINRSVLDSFLATISTLEGLVQDPKSATWR